MTAHPIPAGALAHHIAIVGKTGSGKTFAAKGMVERLLADGARTVIVDPTGVWWGLRLARDGRRASPFKIPVFGGHHADLPLGTDGEALARILGGSATSAILDVQQLSVSQRTDLFTAFAEALLRENRGPLHLVLDEAHLFAPQGGGPGLERAQLLHATNNLVSLGRSAGLRITLISQRPAKLHKDSLTQVDTMVAMRVVSPQDRGAVEDWLAGAPDPSRTGEIASTLASLPVGEGWVYAPEQGVLDRARFPAISTFDSGRPVEAGEMPALKPLDVAALRAAMAAAGPDPSDAGASPPVPRRASASSAEPARPASAVEIAAAEARGYERGIIDGEARGLDRGAKAGWRACAMLFERDINVVSREFASEPGGHEDGDVEIAKALGLAAWPDVKPSQSAPAQRKSSSVTEKTDKPPARVENRDVVGLNGAGRKMLAVLDTNPPVRRSWRQVATLAGLRARGGHFNAGKKGLVDSGLVRVDGDLVAIAAPRADAAPEVRDPAALVETWCAALPGAAPKFLRALFSDSARVGLARAAIAADLGMQPRGGYWNAGWKELRDNGLVTLEGDDARLCDLFDP